jgi:hypothetical protein
MTATSKYRTELFACGDPDEFLRKRVSSKDVVIAVRVDLIDRYMAAVMDNEPLCT